MHKGYYSYKEYDKQTQITESFYNLLTPFFIYDSCKLERERMLPHFIFSKVADPVYRREYLSAIFYINDNNLELDGSFSDKIKRGVLKCKTCNKIILHRKDLILMNSLVKLGGRLAIFQYLDNKGFERI